MRLFVSRTLVWALALGFLSLAGSVRAAREGNTLVWKKTENKVDADIKGWELQKLLERLAKVTGWQVYLEPGTDKRVSTQFKDASTGEALRLLLGDLNYALLPQPPKAPKLLIYRTTLDGATKLIARDLKDPKSKDWIRNEVIVTMNPDAKKGIDELAKELGAKVVGRADEIKSYRLEFPDEASAKAGRASLENNDNVEGTDNNYRLNQPTQSGNNESSSASAFNLKPQTPVDGKNLVVGLIDTPVQPLDGKMGAFMMPAVHLAGDATLAPDQLTHGTSMAETMLNGLARGSTADASGVRILPIDVYGNNAGTTTFDVTKGIYYAIQNGVPIVSMSLGGDGDSPMLRELIQEGHKRGTIFFAAAGNQPTDSPVFPAAYPEVIAVTAGDRRGNIASYANRGDFVDVIAPGTSYVEFNGQTYVVTGTSSSTAFVAGAAAAYRASGQPASGLENYIRQAFVLKASQKQ